jgi:putative DNA primase/helicase
VSTEERRALVWKRWDGSRSLTPDTNSRRYLKSRGIEHGRVWDLRESTRGNLLALVRDLDGNPCQLQCTFLEDGHKAEVERVRKFMQLPFPEGAAVRLLPQGSVLGIAEGVETALSAAQMFSLPVWAALNTSLLRKWRPPAQVQRVYIFADNDKNYAGQAAAYHLAHRLASDDRLGIEVSVEIPLKVGHDWNDVLRSSR